MDEEYFVTRPPAAPSAEEAEALRLAALMRRESEQARLQRRVRGVLQVSGAVAAACACRAARMQ